MRLGCKPEWLTKRWSETGEMARVESLIEELGLNTVCREASCPNYSECFGRGTATFMILGANCTRNCGFCGVRHAAPEPVDAEEPSRVSEAVKRLGLSYVVVTSVTRDDLADGGASVFAHTVLKIREHSPSTKIEVLIPDFGGNGAALGLVAEAAPDVISHNIETVREMYAKMRPQADYDRSLLLLRRVAERSRIKCKSGLMLGVGETCAQVRAAIDDLRAAGCDFLTIGQYLRPSPANVPVEEYIEPAAFDRWAEYARAAGFEFAAAAPFVRSSYHAEEAVNAAL